MNFNFVAEVQNKPDDASTVNKCTLLKIPLLLSIGYTVLIGQAAIGFIDVALSLHLDQVQ